MRTIHFIGIGGVGMNGLAQLAVLTSYSVTGSDRAYDPTAEVFRALDLLGIRISPQDGSGITPETSQVVYSSAIETDNPDLRQAKRFGIPLLHRAEFLKELIGDDKLIAIAGTAGKTTTTGLLGWIFESLGKDPSVYNGAAVLNWKKGSTPGNVRKGHSKLWIIEADESDKSFLNFHPDHSIITNISKDHYELDELNRMFDQFESQTSGITIRGYKAVQASSPISINIIGKHNQENARCAAALCAALGMNEKHVRESIADFKGIERRLEVVGEIDGITVIDDYAHNPAKITAALTAVAATAKRIHAFWRPHGYSPLFQCQEDLIETFRQTQPESLFILPVYYAGGTVQKKTTSMAFVEKLNSAGIPAELVPDYTTLKNKLEHCATPGDTILGMGARDPELPIFLKQLVAEWKTN